MWIPTNIQWDIFKMAFNGTPSCHAIKPVIGRKVIPFNGAPAIGDIFLLSDSSKLPLKGEILVKIINITTTDDRHTESPTYGFTVSQYTVEYLDNPEARRYIMYMNDVAKKFVKENSQLLLPLMDNSYLLRRNTLGGARIHPELLRNSMLVSAFSSALYRRWAVHEGQ